MTSDQKALGYVVTLIFLMEGGIADELERRSVEYTVEGKVKECNLLVDFIASDENSIKQMADFLTAIFASFSNFLTPKYRRFLRKVFFLHMKEWAENSLPVKKCRDAMEQLFAAMLASPNEQLKEHLANYIKSDSDFTGKDKPLCEFAKAVFARDFEARSKSFSSLVSK
jgi:hypothetical protein